MDADYVPGSSIDPTSWYSLDKVQYRKVNVYTDMKWINEMMDGFSSLHTIRSAPFGGPVAVMLNSKKSGNKKLSQVKTEATPTIRIYNAAGNKMSEIKLNKSSSVVDFGWTYELHLVCVFEDGETFTYSIEGEEENKFMLLPSKSNDKVSTVEFWGAGVVAISQKFLMIQVVDIDSARPRVSLMADTPFNEQNSPTSMAILEPRFTKSNEVEAIVATTARSIVIVSKSECTDLELQSNIPSIVTKMATAPNGSFMALYAQDGTLTVLNTKFDKKVLEFKTQAGSSPFQMVWCGEDSVLMYWRKVGVIMVGPFGSWLKFPYDEDLYIGQEADCARIFTRISHDIIQRVPLATESIRRIGSTSSAAMLYDALEAFDAGDAKADESVRSILATGKLDGAITQCIKAAGGEFDQTVQRSMLRAASYGKGFCDDFDSETFVSMCRKLRVLNNIRLAKIAMPLTLQEFNVLTPEVVVGRLVAFKHHFLAIKICEFLKISTDRVLVHWACEKVKRAGEVSDEQIVALVRKKLKTASLVSYAEIAFCAEKVGKRRLATMLLDLEEKPADQVPLLLSMGEFELAIKKSIQSADTNLMYMALLHIERTLRSPEEFKYVLFRDEAYREAVTLMLSYYRQTNSPYPKMKLLWHDSNGNPTVDLGDHDIRNAYKTSNPEKRLEFLKHAMTSYAQAKATFHLKATEEQIELLQEQMKLEEKLQTRLVHLSVAQTVFCIITQSVKLKKHKYIGLASTMAKTFKMSEKKFYTVKIKALASCKQWDLLFQFSNEKRSPACGFKTFALICYDYKEKKMAEEYASRITSNDDRFDCLVYMELWSPALELAIRLKDPLKLTTVRNECTDDKIHKKVDEAAQMLGFLS